MEVDWERKYFDAKNALAEKDKEISQLTQSIEMLRYALQGSQDQYQQLMEKAVRFAQHIKDEFTYDDDPRFVEAEAFLKERT